MKYLFSKIFLSIVILVSVCAYLFSADHYPIYQASDHYSPQTQKFFNPQKERPVEAWSAFKNAWQMSVHPEKFAPKQPLPTEKPDWNTFLSPSANGKFVWLGHSTLLMRLMDKTILIDPVWADSVSPVPIFAKRFQAPPVPLADLPKIDYILYSHNHYDHLDQNVVEHFASQNISFFAPLGVGVLLKKWGVKAENIYELDWWQQAKLGEMNLIAVPARHNTGRGAFDGNKTLWMGYVLQTSTEQIYYSGDSAYMSGEHFRQIGEKFGEFDLAFVENGQYNTAWIDNHMLPAQTAQAVNEVKAKRFVPVHWGAYTLSPHRWKEPVEQSVPLIEQQGISVLTPKLGQVFDKHSETTRWWKEVE